MELHNPCPPRPMNTTLPCPNLTVENMKNVIKSRTKIKTAQADMEQDFEVLQEELKLLNTVLYKNHNRFRNDKGYKTLRMLEKSVQKLQGSNVKSITDDFLGFIPDSPVQSNLHLPTAAMCQYAALQYYNLAALLQKIEILSRKSGLLSMQRLNLGHFWGVAAVNLAVVGRIWTLCRHLLVKVEEIFSHLLKIMKYLPGSVEDYNIPQDLFELFPEDLQNHVRFEAEKQIDATNVNVPVLTVHDFLDLGEPVKRKVDTDEKVVTKKVKIETISNSQESKKDALNDIHSVEQFKNFLKHETDTRKVSKKTCFTKKLSQEEWKAVKKEVISNLNPSVPNKSIKMCRKIIRNALK